MADYLEVDEARARSGLRLVLTAGVPGPWGEAAKNVFDVKQIPYLRVRQRAGAENPELVAWTGRDNAPTAVYDEEPPRSSWFEILALAERLAPAPALVPSDPEDRVRMVGLTNELAGDGGFAWQRRLMILDPLLAEAGDDPPAALAPIVHMGRKYGYRHEAALAAPSRVAQILELLSAQLVRQRAAGRRYLVGTALSALDLYWAAFAAMVEPLPHEQCPMPDYLRPQYRLDPATGIACDPALLAHRDFIYREHLTLPLDF